MAQGRCSPIRLSARILGRRRSTCPRTDSLSENKDLLHSTQLAFGRSVARESGHVNDDPTRMRTRRSHPVRRASSVVATRPPDPRTAVSPDSRASPNGKRGVEPTLGFEPRTCCLRNSCSTAELCRRGRSIGAVRTNRVSALADHRFADTPSTSNNVRTAHDCSYTGLLRVPAEGLGGRRHRRSHAALHRRSVERTGTSMLAFVVSW
jgi:hypothetical protein